MKRILFAVFGLMIACSNNPENKATEKESQQAEFKKLSAEELSKLKAETDSILETDYLCQNGIVNGKKACIERTWFSDEYPNLYCGIVGDDSLYFFTSIRDSKTFAHTHFTVEANGKKLSSMDEKMMLNHLEMSYYEGKVNEECYHDELACRKIIDFFKHAEGEVKLNLCHDNQTRGYTLREQDVSRIKKTISLQEKLRLISQNTD